MIRVLLVEDDPFQLQVAASWIRDAGDLVTECPAADHAMQALQRESFDLVVIDWMMPGMGGDELLRWIRERQRRLPVMFATAKDEEAEIASMLRQGADDYVVKPLRRAEFLARIAALARRAGLVEAEEGETLELGPYRLNTAARSATLDGKPIRMTPRMFELAAMLVRRRGELVSRAQLYEQLWGRKGVDTRTVDTHASRVRQALELDGRHGWRLTAVYQHGYRLEKSADS